LSFRSQRTQFSAPAATRALQCAAAVRDDCESLFAFDIKFTRFIARAVFDRDDLSLAKRSPFDVYSVRAWSFER
jgi:hypothetical protein